LQKSETPASDRGRFHLNAKWNLVAMGRVPGNAGNVGPADADVGKLTVAQARQFVQALVIALPFLDEADKCGKHGIVLSSLKSRPTPAGYFANIGMFPLMKTDNVAMQLSEKCMAKSGLYKGKIQFSVDLRELSRLICNLPQVNSNKMACFRTDL
jgi:hypothetical protein